MFGTVGGQMVLDGLREKVVPDVAGGTGFWETAAGDMGGAQEIVQSPNGQRSTAKSDEGAVRFRAGCLDELESEEVFSPSPARCCRSCPSDHWEQAILRM